MRTIGIYEAKTKLSEICERIARSGEPAIISRNGVPLVKIVSLAGEEAQASVWDSVEESRKKYGPLEDNFDLPERTLLSMDDTPCFEEQ